MLAMFKLRTRWVFFPNRKDVMYVSESEPCVRVVRTKMNVSRNLGNQRRIPTFENCGKPKSVFSLTETSSPTYGTDSGALKYKELPYNAFSLTETIPIYI